MAVILRIRRGTTTQWDSSTKVLLFGELGIDTTLNKIKAGNGTATWEDLPWLHATPDDVSILLQSANEYTDEAITSLGNTAVETYVPLSDVGNPDGVASLDENGKVPDSQIPDGIARDSELFSGSYDDLSDKPTIPSLEGYATETYVGTAISNLVDTAPETLNTLNELAAALGDDPNYATTISTSLGNKLDSSTASSTYAPLANPTFTGTVAGVTSAHVGLGNVDNTSDVNKPVSTATQTALDLKLSLTDPAIDYYITNIGSGSYTVNGVANGPVEFIKGKKYRIHINASGHPFWIQTVSGGYSAGNVYSTGITGNGTQVGHIIVELPQNAPDNLYYACQFHSSMAGAVLVRTDSVSFNAQSSSYTLTTSDSGKIVEMSGGGTLTITDSSSFSVGFTCDVLQTGSSQVTIAGNGFTPNATPGLKLRTQWSSATLIKRALNSWVVLGDLSA